MSNNSIDVKRISPSKEDVLTEQGEISKAYAEGCELLVFASHIEKVNFSDSTNMRRILWDMVKGRGVKFEGASIEEVFDGMKDVCGYMNATIKDDHGRPTYNIWFARKDGKWTLKFCGIPQ